MLKVYIAIIPEGDLDRFDEVLNRLSTNSNVRPNRRIGAIIPAEGRSLYSVKLLDNEVTIMKLSVRGEYIEFEGDPELLWQRMVNLSL